MSVEQLQRVRFTSFLSFAHFFLWTQKTRKKKDGFDAEPSSLSLSLSVSASTRLAYMR